MDTDHKGVHVYLGPDDPSREAGPETPGMSDEDKRRRATVIELASARSRARQALRGRPLEPHGHALMILEEAFSKAIALVKPE